MSIALLLGLFLPVIPLLRKGSSPSLCMTPAMSMCAQLSTSTNSCMGEGKGREERGRERERREGGEGGKGGMEGREGRDGGEGREGREGWRGREGGKGGRNGGGKGGKGGEEISTEPQ